MSIPARNILSQLFKTPIDITIALAHLDVLVREGLKNGTVHAVMQTHDTHFVSANFLNCNPITHDTFWLSKQRAFYKASKGAKGSPELCAAFMACCFVHRFVTDFKSHKGSSTFLEDQRTALRKFDQKYGARSVMATMGPGPKTVERHPTAGGTTAQQSTSVHSPPPVTQPHSLSPTPQPISPPPALRPVSLPSTPQPHTSIRVKGCKQLACQSTHRVLHLQPPRMSPRRQAKSKTMQ